MYAVLFLETPNVKNKAEECCYISPLTLHSRLISMVTVIQLIPKASVSGNETADFREREGMESEWWSEDSSLTVRIKRIKILC